MDGEYAGSLGGALTPYGQERMAVTPSLKQRLALAVKQAEERLAAAKEARELFERNPDLERLLDLMQRGHF